MSCSDSEWSHLFSDLLYFGESLFLWRKSLLTAICDWRESHVWNLGNFAMVIYISVIAIIWLEFEQWIRIRWFFPCVWQHCQSHGRLKACLQLCLATSVSMAALTLSQCTLAGPVYTGMPLECQCTLGYHWATQRILAGYTGTPLEKLSWIRPHWDATG